MPGSNIFDHVVDDASTVTVELSTTAFGAYLSEGADENNVQSCLEIVDAHALQPLPPVPSASETAPGIIEIATTAEVQAGTSDTLAVTPLKLGTWIAAVPQRATEAKHGTVKIATNAELAGASATSVVTPWKLDWYASNVRIASESARGFVRLATSAEAVAGSGSGAMTPVTTIDAINAWAAGSDSTATTTAKGLVELADSTEANDDTVQNRAVTPWAINFRQATTTKRGAFRLPQASDAAARTSNDHAITPGTLGLFVGTTSQIGAVKLVNSLTSTATDAALSAAMGKQLEDTKIGETGGTITGTLKVNTITKVTNEPIMTDGKFTSQALLNQWPIGSIYISTTSTSPATLFGGTWSQYGQGRVLLGAGSATDSRGETRSFTAGATGGEYEHEITIQETPEHKHAGWGESSSGNGLGWGVATQYNRNNMGSAKTDWDNYLYYSSPVGENEAHNNMQPYMVVYMWTRTA